MACAAVLGTLPGSIAEQESGTQHCCPRTSGVSGGRGSGAASSAHIRGQQKLGMDISDAVTGLPRMRLVTQEQLSICTVLSCSLLMHSSEGAGSPSLFNSTQSWDLVAARELFNEQE